MNKRERELRIEMQDLAAAYGGRLMKLEMTGGHHYRLTFVRRDGSAFHYIMAYSPSDYRALRNARALLRRYFR